MPVSPTTRGTSSFKVERSVKVPHADSTRLGELASGSRTAWRLLSHKPWRVTVSRSCCGRSGSKLKHASCPSMPGLREASRAVSPPSKDQVAKQLAQRPHEAPRGLAQRGGRHPIL